MRTRDTSVARATGKRTRNVAVLFVDIEGCTRLCEDLPPREMDHVIERYFSRFLDVVRDQGGEVTEVLGDGLLALFPGKSLRRDATNALVAAFGIQDATAALNDTPGRRHDPIVVNIGINAGAALVGTTRLRGRTGKLQFNKDGSLDIYIQHASPGRDKESNWLPAPKGDFDLVLRAYWPMLEVLAGGWNPPAVKRAK